MDGLEKILVPLLGDDMAPRFDLVQEVAIITVNENRQVVDRKILVLAEASAESLCQLILNEKIGTVVCCGIEEEYYQYLTWKKVKVVDYISGSLDAVIRHLDKNPEMGTEIFVEPDQA